MSVSTPAFETASASLSAAALASVQGKVAFAFHSVIEMDLPGPVGAERSDSMIDAKSASVDSFVRAGDIEECRRRDRWIS